MKGKTVIRVVAFLGLLALVIGALLPAFSAWHS